MINIKLKSVFLGLMVLISAVTLSGSPACSIVVHAEEETLGEELQRDLKWLYDKGKEQGGKAASWAAENAPKAVDKVKEEVPKLIEDAKEAAPGVADKVKSGITEAGEAISDYREEQEGEFIDWFEDQTNTGESNSQNSLEDDSQANAADAETLAEVEDGNAIENEPPESMQSDNTAEDEPAEDAPDSDNAEQVLLEESLIEDDAEASRNITDGLSRGEFILLGVLIALAVLIGVVLGGFIMAKILLRNPRHKQ